MEMRSSTPTSAGSHPGGAAAGDLDGEGVEGIAVQRRLHRHYTALLAEPERFMDVPSDLHAQEVHEIERAWLDRLDARAVCFELPAGPARFKEWYLGHAARHTAGIAELTDHLKDHASLAEMAMFFVVEEKVDSKFDDLMALAQLGTSGEVKLAIGANYWDEMGEGDPRLIHTTLFHTSVTWMRGQLAAAGIDPGRFELPELYANANQLLLYGLNRRYAPRLLGALGVLEQTASQRFQAMVDGCARLGVPPAMIAYQSLHVGIDHDHGAEWLERVLLPLVQRSPELLEEICRGVLTRCDVAIRYYNAVKSRLLSGGRERVAGTEAGGAKGEDVVIRGAKRSDVRAVHEIMSKPNVIWGTTVMPCPSEFAVEEALAAENRHWFIAASAWDDGPLGYLYLDWGEGRWRRIASLVMAVRDDASGRGIGRKLIDAAIRVGFHYLDLQRIELEVYIDNPAAVRLYERAGFVHEGTKRRNAIRHGVHVDGHMMALLKSLDG